MPNPPSQMQTPLDATPPMQIPPADPLMQTPLDADPPGCNPPDADPSCRPLDANPPGCRPSWMQAPPGCNPLPWMQTPSLVNSDACWEANNPPPPTVNRMTQRCKNITCPKLGLRVVKIPVCIRFCTKYTPKNTGTGEDWLKKETL